MKTTKSVSASLVLAAAGIWLAGCATNGQSNNAPGGALLGGLLGAGLGAVVGHQSGHTAEGAAIGGALGAGGGYIVGNEQDKAQLQAQNAQAISAANTMVINVTNSNGSITPVTLQRQGNEYIGPKGEHYLQLPTSEQLHSIYGF